VEVVEGENGGGGGGDGFEEEDMRVRSILKLLYSYAQEAANSTLVLLPIKAQTDHERLRY
jgi:hypothetical protein